MKVILTLCALLISSSLDAGPGHDHSGHSHHNVDDEKKAVIRNKRAALNRLRGKVYLEDYKKQAGVVVLESGIAYRILEKGEGKIPTMNDLVETKYEGRLLSGKVFSSSSHRGAPTRIMVSKVMRGWQEILTRMPEGSRWEVVIPPDLAYGEEGLGSHVGPNAYLTFDIKLLKVIPLR